MIHPVILCGGSGTRLWPVSRKTFPKQFAPLVDEESLYQKTLKRFAAAPFTAPLVVTAEDFRFLARGQAAAVGIDDARIVIEPQGRDTAPAVAIAALILEEDADALMLIAPSDHLIGDAAAFHETVAAGVRDAHGGAFVTAEVTIGDEVRLVAENESVYIPLGMKHRMANKGRVPMYLIEVQTGAYLGEDDIERYEDVYHRV